MPIYQPAEDSYLLSETLQKYLKDNLKNKTINKKINKKINKEIKILDMGTGSGIQARTCKKLGFNNILAVDINPEAVKNLKKQKIKSIKSNLFSNIPKKGKFDFIIFNPPYLPENKYDKEPDTTAGKKGYELILKFLKQAKNHINQKSKILLLFSTLSHPKIILKNARELGYDYKLINKKNLFFEKLFVYEFSEKS